MRIVQINATCGVGSTGKICVGISKLLTERCVENYILYSSRTNGHAVGVSCSNDRDIKIQSLKAKVLGNYGLNSKKATQRMIDKLDQINPDIVHLHNIHGHDCSLELLFSYFKDKKTKVIWTFHDCWAFTGYCPHFAMVKCDKWKTECANCVQRREFSWFFDRSRELFQKKKKLFQGLDLTIVTPSQWLADLVKQSFLKEYPIKVINNGIDLTVFRPTEGAFRKKYQLEDKKIVLGVAFDWGVRKGLDVFVELASRLDKTYQIVLVGTNDTIDRTLPKNILSIHRTQDQKELAEIYTAADVFVNPTREENFPTVNMEALACGTPVITFKTGGSPEVLDDLCGCVVPCDDVVALTKAIVSLCEDQKIDSGCCIKRISNYNQQNKYEEYMTLYVSD